MDEDVRIKVLHVAPQPPPLSGMVSYIQGLLGSDVFKRIDSRVVRLDYLGKERFRGATRILINILNAVILTTVFVFQSLLWQPDIVHIQTNSGFGFFEKSWIALLAKLMRRRSLMHVHGGNFREFYQQSPHVVQFLIRRCAQLNDRIVTASPQMRDTWLLIGLSDTKIINIANAVNLPTIEKDYVPHDKVVILFLTRIVLAKGIIEIIDAVRTLHISHDNLQLRIVGAEEFETIQVREYLANIDAAEYIKYIGPVSESDKHHEYSSADIFAFPTHVEDQSYAVMEAMSYGLPCVASNVGGVPSLIKDGINGILVPPKDVDSLVSALERLINGPELRRKLGLAARKMIEDEFNWTRRATEMIVLYQRVIEQ